MWTKPKFWGGHNTENYIFYLADKNGKQLHFEICPDWQEQYELWLTGKSKASILGMKLKD